MFTINEVINTKFPREPITYTVLEGLYCFYCTRLNFERKLPKRDRRPLRRDAIASHDRFQPMGVCQNLTLD